MLGLRMLFAAALLCVAGVSGLFYLATRPTHLRVGVASDDPGSRQVLLAADGVFRERKKSIRLRTVTYRNAQEVATALGAGTIDLAALRPDSAANTSAEAVLVLRRDALIILARDAPTDAVISALKGRRLAIVPFGSMDSSARLAGFLEFYGLPRDAANMKVVQPGQLSEAISDDALDVIALLGPATAPAVAAAVRWINEKFASDSIVGIPDAEALAQRVGEIETVQLPVGIFRGNPALPAEKKDTVAIPVRLLAGQNVDDGAVYTLLQQFLAARSAIRRAAPGYEHFEVPDPEESPVLVHQGARAFRDGESVGFFDRYGDFLYLGFFVAGGLASVATAIAAQMSIRRRRRVMNVLHDLQSLGHAVSSAVSLTELEASEAQVDHIMASVFDRAARCELSADDLAAINLAFGWWRGQVDDMRQRLAA